MDLNTVVAVMAVDMKSKYDKYWGDVVKMNQFLYFGVVFDPRFKFDFIEWSFEDMYGAGSELAKDMALSVRENVFKLYNLYKSVHERHQVAETTAAPTGQSSSQVQTTVAPSIFARKDAYKQHLKQKVTIEQQNELERYLSDPPETDDAKFDILTWWKQNCTRYPVLAAMAKEILATPVSTVASESAFSTGGRVLDTYRSSLSPGMVEALICAQSWLKPSMVDNKDLIEEEYELSLNAITDAQNMLVGGGTSGASGSGTAGEAPPAAGPPT
ncbi:zinc finger BED domain-containing protein RICESLEEPER [Trifolium repens]|nr:zinc finger BED domain-containing protein RICESLEEPER [Trifolium repens]